MASAAVGACTACVALVVRAQPAADVARRPLTWRAPAGCPDEASVNADVAGLLAGSNAPLRANAEVEHVGGSWRVVVSMNGGVRRLEATSCRALAEATELIVAMAVDPVRVARNRSAQGAVVDAGIGSAVASDASTLRAFEPGDAGGADAAIVDAAAPFVVPVAPVNVPNAETSPVDAGTPVDAAPSAPLRRAPDVTNGTTTFAVEAAGVVDLGTLPAPGIAPSIGFAWTPFHFRFELAGAYFLPNSTSPTTTGVIERFTMLTVAARACYLARADSFELGPCVEAEVASVHGDGIVALPQSGSSTWIAPGAGIFGAWRFAPSWAVFGRGDALIPTIRPDFQVDGTTLHRPAFLTGRLSLGAELRF
jgi:hypothetical protein